MTSSIFGVIICSQEQKFDQIRAIKFQIKKISATYKDLRKVGKNMNAYYQRTNRTVVVTDNKPLDINIGDKLISLICAVIAFFTSTVAVAIEKATLSVLGFVAFFGVVGSIELGSISMLAGVAICSVISIAEFFILKSLIKKGKAS